MALYGTQTKPTPSGATLGYAPNGQIYNQNNPVAMTTSGVRPLSVANNRVTPAGQGSPNVYAPGEQQRLASIRPHAWTAAGKQQASQEQYQYGNDFYGNPAATGGLGGSGGASGQPGTGQYQTGITAGIIPPSVVQQAFGSMGVKNGPGAGAANTQYNDLMRQGLNQVGTQFGRDAAFDMSNLDLAQQRARADAGLGAGNLLARLFEGNLANDRTQQGLTGNFLMGLLG